MNCLLPAQPATLFVGAKKMDTADYRWMDGHILYSSPQGSYPWAKTRPSTGDGTYAAMVSPEYELYNVFYNALGYSICEDK